MEHCPTDKMEGDCMSKPLQESKFKAFQTSILNLEKLGMDPVKKKKKQVRFE